MVHFVGAGPGDPELITVRGRSLLEKADMVIYAGSLVNPALLAWTKPGCAVYDSAGMTLEEVLAAMELCEQRYGDTVRLHTGDPSLYGAIREQMDALDARHIPWDMVPGVSAFSGAAAALGAEYTLPGVSQTLIISRSAGRTPVPEKEALPALAAHGASMALYLSAGMAAKVRDELLAGGYSRNTPAAIVYKASWPEERIVRGTVGALAEMAADNAITKTALILVGGFLGEAYGRSKLYDPGFSHGYRRAKP